MIRTLETRRVPCPCTERRGLGALDLNTAMADWKTWALFAAVALALFLLLQNSPKRQERAVAQRRARAKYKAELAKIGEEYR